jgi:hypothetical protein
MRVDVHAYLGHWPFRKLPGNTCDALLARMNRYGVDLSVVGNIHGIFYKNTQAANEELAEWVRPHHARLLPFAVVNPTYAGWKRDLEVCRKQLGMKGVRLYPQYHDYKPGDAACAEAVRAATELGMPVAFSLRLIDDRQRSWLDIDKELSLEEMAAVAEAVPRARIIVLHAMISARPFNRTATDDEKRQERALEILKQADVLFDTVYASGCGVVGPNAYDLPAAIERYGRDKFAFGTASPFREYVSPFLRIEVMKEADAATKELLWSGNAQRFLKL